MLPSVTRPIQHLVSLPPRMAEVFGELERRTSPLWYAGHDPAGAPLGSGGGTAHLLVEAWRSLGQGEPFRAWLTAEPKLILHAGGLSRRLPAYAVTGKVLMPIPVFRWSRGQRLDQSLLDIQLPDYERILRHAPPGYAALVTSGDVLLRFDAELPPFPEVDVLGLGMWTTAETAQNFGVFFARRRDPGALAFFLQKPAPETIRALAGDHLFLVDTGMWLLSARAIEVLMRRCGWDPGAQVFSRGHPTPFELYAQFGLALGAQPSQPDPEIATLTSAVVPLPRPEFYHFGTSRQMIESLSALQNRELDQTRLSRAGGAWHPDQYVQNARFEVAVHRTQNPTLWIENSHIPSTWKLTRDHVLTGIPENHWPLQLEPGVCLDFVPVGDQGWAIRFYGIDDPFSGALADPATLLLGRPAREWFGRRGVTLDAAGLGAEEDLQRAALFPVVGPAELDAGFVAWLCTRQPAHLPACVSRWLKARRLSAQQLPAEADPRRLYQQRAALRVEALTSIIEHRSWSVFHRLDLQSSARVFAASGRPLPAEDPAGEPLDRVHEVMFRAAVLRQRGQDGWQREEERAFGTLREAMVREAQLAPAQPRLDLVEDQIVWARSPVRFDLAGGWTDTPPYCLEHGGQVVNVAVDLNGQPPMQVFLRRSSTPEIVLRSIDLGFEERIRTYEHLETFVEPGSAFALAKAACALAGFLPRFHATGGYRSLTEQLGDFGAGLELSLLSAVPKGSGLGTSSILAATVLGALSEACALGWDRATLFTRTLALEQMITTGGGWQDQAGGLFPGIKLIETEPGMVQVPHLRWLPGQVFQSPEARRRILLYYTGLTRMAKGILAEIVRGIFLNSPDHLATLAEIGASARSTALAIEHCDYAGLADAIRNTWRLKQQLDRGTNPPEVQSILEAIDGDLVAATLPGAGGGGYLLLFARDEDAGARIRRCLTERPPNARARFVEFNVSETGLQVTRS